MEEARIVIVSDPAFEAAPGQWQQNQAAFNAPAAETSIETAQEDNWQPRAGKPKVTPAAPPAAHPEIHEPGAQTRQAKPRPRVEKNPRIEKKAAARKPEPKAEAKSETEVDESRPNAGFDSGFDAHMNETARLKDPPAPAVPSRHPAIAAYRAFFCAPLSASLFRVR